MSEYQCMCAEGFPDRCPCGEVIAADVHDDLRERDGWSIQQLTMEVERLRRLHTGAVKDVADLVNALADAASRFRRDGDGFGAEQAEAILKRFGGSR